MLDQTYVCHPKALLAPIVHAIAVDVSVPGGK